MTRLFATFILGVTACGGSPAGDDVSEPASVTSTQPATDEEPLPACEERKDQPEVPLTITAGMATGIDDQLTPPLPLSWPPTDDRVVYLKYTARALPTGEIVYEVSEPHARIVLSTLTQQHVEEPLTAEPAVLGPFRQPPDNPLADDSIEPAMQAVLDVASQRRCAEEARAEIRGYCSWFELEHPIARWAEERHSAFVSWLSCDPTAAD